MKSAYELAMERLGGKSRELTTEQKEALAEIDKIYEAKIAQASFSAQNKLTACQNDPQKRKQLEEGALWELRALEEEREKKKEELRKSFDKA